MTRVLHIPTGEFILFISSRNDRTLTQFVSVLELAAYFDAYRGNELSKEDFEDLTISRILTGKSGILYGSSAHNLVKDEAELEFIYD
jgi:hypothetical protein